MSGHDPRVTPAREDLAAESLRGILPAPRYARGRSRRIATDFAPLHRLPDPGSTLDTQLLRGESFDVYEVGDGWAWGQARLDGYVGYVPVDRLDEFADSPTHRVIAPAALHYSRPEASAPAIAASWYASRLRMLSEEPVGGFLEAAAGGWVHARQVARLADREADPVETALRFDGAPYLLGGRTARGLDCSALVQLAFAGPQRRVPRDSDQQRAGLGEPVAEDEPSRRGDLVFWEGHVGILCAPDRLVHANAHHMAVAVEPLREAVERLAARGLPVLARRRIPS